MMGKIHRHARTLRMKQLAFALWLLPLLSSCQLIRKSPGGPNWLVTWGTSQQVTEPNNLPPEPGLAGNTLRQRVRVSVGGSSVRLRLSNTFGNGPITIGGASIALSSGGSAASASSMRRVQFRGLDSVTIAAGQMVTADAFDFAFDPLSDVTISLFITSMPSVVTGHPGSRTTSYIVRGNHILEQSPQVAAETDHWYIIADMETVAPHNSATIVTLGNSITDGRGSGTNKQNRWPDNLARRLQASAVTRAISVVNAGIGGNAVVRGGLGPTAQVRFDRDVLDRPNVKWVLLLEGVNDIGVASAADAPRVADELIAAYQSMTEKARARGIKMYGCTILPFGQSFYDLPEREAARQKVNAYIRSAGAFDAVVDFDAAMRDPSNPRILRADVDGGDHLHPNELGYVRMADAIDLALFKR